MPPALPKCKDPFAEHKKVRTKTVKKISVQLLQSNKQNLSDIKWDVNDYLCANCQNKCYKTKREENYPLIQEVQSSQSETIDGDNDEM